MKGGRRGGVRRLEVGVGVIAAAPGQFQEAADRLAEAGVGAILSLGRERVRVPPRVALRR